MVQTALHISYGLAKAGISCCVVNIRFVKPLDTDLIHDLARRVNLLVTLEEHAVHGGFGSAVLESLQCASIRCSVTTMGIPDEFGPEHKSGVSNV